MYKGDLPTHINLLVAKMDGKVCLGLCLAIHDWLLGACNSLLQLPSMHCRSKAGLARRMKTGGTAWCMLLGFGRLIITCDGWVIVYQQSPTVKPMALHAGRLPLTEVKGSGP